jgi:hypothetical protein
MTEPTCYICKTRKCEPDYEGGRVSYSSTCHACFGIIACAPYCYNPDCGQAKTQLVNAGRGITKESALFACPNGCGQATRIGWAIGNGRHSGRDDAERKLAGDSMGWLVDTRLEHVGADVSAEHPERRAYAVAYVTAARELLGV